jgi:hypothetical protein
MTILNAKDEFGDPEGWAHRPTDLLIGANLMGLVKQCGDVLESHYPGWMWVIEPDERGGIVNVSSMRFPPVNLKRPGFTLHISTIQTDIAQHKLMMFAGELIERFGCRRGAYNSEHWMAVNRACVAKYGAFVPDATDQSAGVQKSLRADAIRDGIRTGRARVLTEADLRGMRHAAA